MEALKDIYFQEAFVLKLSKYLSASKNFDQKAFVDSLTDDGFKAMALKEKLRFCAQTMGECVGLPYLEALPLVVSVAKHFDDFDALVFAEFIDVYGRDDFDQSLEALGQVTQYGSSEFAIRYYLNEQPDKVMSYLKELASSPQENIRRFASEACRPKLPWGKKVAVLYEEAYIHKILEILDILKEDESLFVRKSVANNLNDLSKIMPNLVIDTAKKWYGQAENTDWILKHGLRSLLKKGNKSALNIWGLDSSEGVLADAFSISHAQIGKTSQISVCLNVLKDKHIRVSVYVHYLKKNGTYSKKSFLISEKAFGPGIHQLSKKMSFKQMTTRTHYPGAHKLELVVNGDTIKEVLFDLKSQ